MTTSLIFVLFFETPIHADGLTPLQLQSLLSSAPTSKGLDAVAKEILANTLQANGGDASNTVVKAAGTQIARSSASRAADLLNIMDYGAKCDGVTDDTGPINAVFNQARLLGNGWHVVFPSGKQCLVTSTLNWTNLIGSSNVIDGAGAKIVSRAAGMVAVDALGMRWVRVRDLTIVGDAVATPTTGIQVGRYEDTSVQSADDLLFDNVQIVGSFSNMALLDEQAETSLFVDCNFSNSYNNGKSYTVVLDGLNHWNAQSHFVGQTQSVDKAQSFLSTQFINSSFYSYNTQGAPLWMAGTSDTKFSHVYVASVAGPVGVELYSIPGSNNSLMDFDGHFETGALQYAFFISGTNSAPSFDGFSYRDENPFFTKAIFKLDSGISSATMADADIQVHYAANTSVVAFNEPSQWFYTGKFWSGSNGMWNLPSSQYRGLYYTGETMRSSVDTISLPLDRNSVQPVLSADSQHAGIQINTGITAATVGSIGQIYGLSIGGGGDPNGQWTIGKGVSDSSSSTTPYLDFAGHGHAQDARIWSSADRRLEIETSDSANNLVDMFDCEAATGCWFPHATYDYGNHYLAKTKLYLDTSGTLWVEEINNKVVIGTTANGIDTRLMSLDSSGNMIVKGTITGNGSP